MSLSTHVLNGATGRPVADMTVTLARREPDGAWTELDRRSTDSDGRIAELAAQTQVGVYRLHFDVEHAVAKPCFYPEVSIVFTVEDPAQHYHVPLLLSPYAYSTYRGS